MNSKLPEIPDALRALMAEIGPRWGTNPAAHVKIMVDRFSEVLKQSPKDVVTVRRGISYGPHPRQTFDLFKPDDENARRAAVVFVHGGAFLDGHPNRTEEIYSNVLHYFARNGIVGLNIGYRLAGDAKYPGASEDIASVIKWVRAHADEVGIGTKRAYSKVRSGVELISPQPCRPKGLILQVLAEHLEQASIETQDSWRTPS